jgi:hypothetical protein
LPAGVHDFASLVPAETMRASRIWNEWGRPNEGGFHMLGVPLQRDGDRLGGIYFHRREAEPPFGPPERAVLAALFPHLGRLLAVEARRGVSPDTVKSQMAAIRRKTGCRHQAELAALLARLPG